MTPAQKREITAIDIMTKPVEAVGKQDTIREVARLFTENHISAAAVLDDAGHPVGVITKTDIVRYEKEKDGIKTVDKKKKVRGGDDADTTPKSADDYEKVQTWMTPVIFSVRPETPMHEIARRMVRYGIHHIFVQGKHREPIVGIVSSFDVLRKVAADPKSSPIA